MGYRCIIFSKIGPEVQSTLSRDADNTIIARKEAELATSFLIFSKLTLHQDTKYHSFCSTVYSNTITLLV